MSKAPKPIPGHRATILRLLSTYQGAEFAGMKFVPHYVIIQKMYGPAKAEQLKDARRVLRVTMHMLRRAVGHDNIRNDEVLGYALAPDFNVQPWLEVNPE